MVDGRMNRAHGATSADGGGGRLLPGPVPGRGGASAAPAQWAARRSQCLHHHNVDNNDGHATRDAVLPGMTATAPRRRPASNTLSGKWTGMADLAGDDQGGGDVAEAEVVVGPLLGSRQPPAPVEPPRRPSSAAGGGRGGPAAAAARPRSPWAGRAPPSPAPSPRPGRRRRRSRGPGPGAAARTGPLDHRPVRQRREPNHVVAVGAMTTSATGMPRASVSRWRLVPGLPRSGCGRSPPPRRDPLFAERGLDDAPVGRLPGQLEADRAVVLPEEGRPRPFRRARFDPRRVRRVAFPPAFERRHVAAAVKIAADRDADHVRGPAAARRERHRLQVAPSLVRVAHQLDGFIGHQSPFLGRFSHQRAPDRRNQRKSHLHVAAASVGCGD